MMEEGDCPSPRGIKRPADETLDNEQRLSKRLGLLNLGKDIVSSTGGIEILMSLQNAMAKPISSLRINTNQSRGQ